MFFPSVCRKPSRARRTHSKHTKSREQRSGNGIADRHGRSGVAVFDDPDFTTDAVDCQADRPEAEAGSVDVPTVTTTSGQELAGTAALKPWVIVSEST